MTSPGTIVGVVDRKKMIDGSRIKPGDVVLGLAANGLHTNGYSLARKILFETMGLEPGFARRGHQGHPGRRTAEGAPELPAAAGRGARRA